MQNIPDQTTKFSEQVENIVRIIKHGKREQVLFILGFLCLALANLFKEKEKYDVTPIYWEAIPENSAEELLRAIHIACPEEKERLRNLDDVIENVSGTKKVIIIDQAEQLSPEKHSELFELFKKIVARKPPYTTTWIIAFREEYASTWFDFECSIPNFYPLKYPLKIFTEQQAQENMAVLAKGSGLAPDAAVLVEMVNAMSDRGKVSPVEIGIGMMLLCELYSGRSSDVSLGSFKDAGGVTGLLRTYIKRKIEDGLPEHERSPMEKTLLDLIDAEKPHQRLSTGKSTPDLAKTAQLPLNRMGRNLSYLASQTVRILEQLPATSQIESNTMYRLAHERLIPALESLAGELLAAAEQAKRLLNERYRIWVKVKRRKFLLSGKELRDVLKYRSQFRYDMRPELLQYIRDSNKRRYMVYSLSILFVLSLILWQPFYNKVIEPWQRKQRILKFEKQFVEVKGGVFEMGDSLGNVDEKPVHEVKLDSFKISKYEITNQQYCDFLNLYDSSEVKVDKWLDFLSSHCQIREKDGQFVVLDQSKRDHPVVEVTWFGAVSFCNYLSECYGYHPCFNLNDWSCDFSVNGFRLPTEAEWEYAARGGHKSKGYKYSGSDSVDVVAWYYGNSGQELHSVGKKEYNELGLFDMSGNAWEWCNDWYGKNYYGESPGENPNGPPSGEYRLLRGGSWNYNAPDMRCAYRAIINPQHSVSNIGFRCVR